jgi:hypothetical protein
MQLTPHYSLSSWSFAPVNYWETIAEMKATGTDTALKVDLDFSSDIGFYRVRLLDLVVMVPFL